MERQRTPKETLFTLSGRDGRAYSLVCFDCGGYGIARDGSPIHALYWPGGTDQGLRECILHRMRTADQSLLNA
jgi:hypothetical protein